MGYSSSDKEILRDALLSILREGLLRARARGWDGHAGMCAIEADHLHNIPELIRALDPESLRYYYEVERTCFLELATHTEGFEPDWRTIEPFVNRTERRKWKLWRRPS